MRKSILCLSLLVLSTSVFAQKAAANTAVDRLFKALNAEKLYTQLGYQALQSFAPLVGLNGEKGQQVAKIIETEVVPELRANRPIFDRALKAAYTKRMSGAEMTQAAVFLESPAGKKLSDAQREAPEEAAASLNAMKQKMELAVVPRILAKMKAAGLKVPPSGSGK
jgi:Uncharacterized protein conserved in bacteria (DUF2059)